MDEPIESKETEEKTDEQEEETKPKKFSWTKDRIVLAILFVIIMLVSIALLVMIIIDKTFIFTIVIDYFIAPIINLHPAVMALIFLCLMILQSLFAPIPSEIILLSGGMLFGLWWGMLLGLVGSMLSAAVTFYLSKRGGRSIIDAAGTKVKIIDRTILIFDRWIKSWGLWAIIVGRAVPVIGIANVKDGQYFLATFIGSIPRTIFYAFLGVQLIGNEPPSYLLTLSAEEFETMANQFNTIFFIIFGVLVFMFVLSNVLYYVIQNKKKKAEALKAADELLDDKVVELKEKEKLVEEDKLELNGKEESDT